MISPPRRLPMALPPLFLLDARCRAPRRYFAAALRPLMRAMLPPDVTPMLLAFSATCRRLF